MQTSVWSMMLYSWSVYKETCFKRVCVCVLAEVTQEGGLLSADAAQQIKVKDNTGVFFLPSSLTNSWFHLHTVSTEMSTSVVFLSLEAFGSHLFLYILKNSFHTQENCKKKDDSTL